MLFRRVAAISPAGTAMASAMMKPRLARDKVRGSASAIACDTGMLLP
jgi:hypothetical protein